MRLSVRPFAFTAVCALAILSTACGSNNKGKIVGKWKLTEVPGSKGEEFSQMNKLGIYLYFDFRTDNTMEMGIGSDNPELLEAMKPGMPGGKISWVAKYKLLSRDGVEIYDLPKEIQEKGGGLFGKNGNRARTKIKIVGESMTMTDDDGQTGKLTKIQ